MSQEKFNKALQDKTDMHEMYLEQKQEVLELKQELTEGGGSSLGSSRKTD
jgi:hypothetical protein